MKGGEVLHIRVLKAFMKKCRLCNKEPTWEGLRNFSAYIKKELPKQPK